MAVRTQPAQSLESRCGAPQTKNAPGRARGLVGGQSREDHGRPLLLVRRIGYTGASSPDGGGLSAKCFQRGGRTDVGGMGSGRTRRRVTDESTGSFVLGVKGLLGPLPRGRGGRRPVTLRSSRWGELAVEVRLDTTDPAAPHLELTH